MNLSKASRLAAIALGLLASLGVALAGHRVAANPSQASPSPVVSDIAPTPPKGSDAPATFPATTSRLTLTATFPKAALQALLDDEKVVPKSYHFDETDKDGVRAYGDLSRGAITVVIDPAAKRLGASTDVKGHVQVEKKVLVQISVGLDVEGDISASISPVIDAKWDVNPQLDLAANLKKAVAKTVVGDIDVTGLVRGGVGNAFNGSKKGIETKLKEAIDLRKRCEKLWGQIAGVHKLADDPTTWLRIIPKGARFGQFEYAPDSITARLALDLEARAFIQDGEPEVAKPPLADLQVGQEPERASVLSLVVEVPHEAVNRRLKAQLTKAPMTLRNDGELTIIDANISSYKEGILLALNFRAKQGASKATSGRMYVTGDVVVDPLADELRLSKLAFTTDTKESLDKDADWLGQSEPIRPMTDASVIKLGDTLAKAKKAANDQLVALKDKLSREFAVDMTITEVHVDNFVFAKDQTFAIVTAKGTMSAMLKP